MKNKIVVKMNGLYERESNNNKIIKLLEKIIIDQIKFFEISLVRIIEPKENKTTKINIGNRKTILFNRYWTFSR
jgi:hypothetical protein